MSANTPSSQGTYPPKTPHLNSRGLVIKSNSETGRGVYASYAINANIAIEISPVLLFTREEYIAHGKHTALDSYTYVWKDRSKGGEKTWALALGLGISEQFESALESRLID